MLLMRQLQGRLLTIVCMLPHFFTVRKRKSRSCQRRHGNSRATARGPSSRNIHRVVGDRYLIENRRLRKAMRTRPT